MKRKHDIPETNEPVYDEIGPKNAQQLLEMKENIAYGPKMFKIKENPAYIKVLKNWNCSISSTITYTQLPVVAFVNSVNIFKHLIYIYTNQVVISRFVCKYK